MPHASTSPPPMPPTTLSTTEAVGLTGGVLVLAGVIWRAVRGSAKASTRGLVIEDEPTFADAVFAVLKKEESRFAEASFLMLEHNAPRLKSFISGPLLYEREMASRELAASTAREAKAQVAQLAATMEGTPLILERLTVAIEGVKQTLDTLNRESSAHRADLAHHGREVAELRGEFTAYTGAERRHNHDRRGSRGLRASDREDPE